MYASYAWEPPCDQMRGRGSYYAYTGPNRLETYAACFVADDLTRGPAATRLKSLPICLVFPLLKCTTPTLEISRADGYESGSIDGGGGESFFVVSAYGALHLSFSADDNTDATFALRPAAWMVAGAGSLAGLANPAVMVENITCNGTSLRKCSAVLFAVNINGQVANAGKNQTLCATVTNDQVTCQRSCSCPCACYPSLICKFS